MKLSFELSRAAAQADAKTRTAPTGALLRPVVVTPEETRMMKDMFDLSGRLARSAAEHNERQTRSFDAGMTNDWNRDFRGTYGNANTEIFSFFYNIWARVRTIAKDMPHGKAIVRAYQNNVVGHDPFKLTMRVGKNVSEAHPKSGATVSRFRPDVELNDQVMLEWRKFCRPRNFTIRRTISFMEAMRQAIAEAKTIGSVIIRKWRGFPGNKYGFAVDILESDRLQPNFQTNNPETGNPIRGSIEYHKTWNYPVAYWILVRHPGEFVAQNYPGTGQNRNVLRERVPAEDIIHFNNLRDRAEQDLGFTELDACVQNIYMNWKYAGALTQASVASACKPWVIEKNTPTGLTYTPTAEEYGSLLSRANDQGDAALAKQGIGDPAKEQTRQTPSREVLSPAMTKILEWGYTMKVLDPKFPIEAAHDFRKDNNHEISTAAGVSFQEMTGIYESLGYIAAQMSQLPSRDNYMVNQAHMIDVIIQDIFAEWLRAAIVAGVIDASIDDVESICDAANFKAKRWPFTDMLREVQALILKMDARLISPQQAQDEMSDGGNYEDVVAQISEAMECEESHGLPPLMEAPTSATDKQVGAIPGDEPDPAAGGDESPPAKSKPAKPKGSSTAKGQTVATTRRSRAVISPQVMHLLDSMPNGH